MFVQMPNSRGRDSEPPMTKRRVESFFSRDARCCLLGIADPFSATSPILPETERGVLAGQRREPTLRTVGRIGMWEAQS